MTYKYKLALEVAGAEVVLFQEFGDYHGSWWAKVKYKNKLQWINGSFGSCSGCDHFEEEFRCDTSHYHKKDYIPTYNFKEKYNEKCKKCQKLKEKLIKFGESYLVGHNYTQKEAENKTNKDHDWDEKSKEVYDFIIKNKL